MEGGRRRGLGAGRAARRPGRPTAAQRGDERVRGDADAPGVADRSAAAAAGHLADLDAVSGRGPALPAGGAAGLRGGRTELGTAHRDQPSGRLRLGGHRPIRRRDPLMTSPNGTALGTATSDPAAEQLFFEIFLTPRDDPYPAYRRLRETAPVLLTGDGTLVLTRFAECDAALRHRSFGKGNELAGFGLPGGAGEQQRQAQGRLGHSMLFANPPEHTRLRRSVGSVFTTRHIQDLRASIEDRTRKHLGQLARRSGGDFVDTLALPLPVNVIADLLGVPEADRMVFTPKVRQMVALLEPAADPEAITAAAAAEADLVAYFTDLLAAKRADPHEDLLSRMATAPEQARLSQQEMISTSLLLFGAGFETTTNLLSNTLHALLDHPDQQAALRADPALIPTAVEEFLRYDSPVQVDARTVLHDTDFAGTHLKAGQVIVMLLGAANHDPDLVEQPDT
ncbi:cytochrome P450, partial [Actinomadura geliboluensis]